MIESIEGVEFNYSDELVRVEGMKRPGERKRFTARSDHPMNPAELAELDTLKSRFLGIEQGRVRRRYEAVLSDDRTTLEVNTLDVPADAGEEPSAIERMMLAFDPAVGIADLPANHC